MNVSKELLKESVQHGLQDILNQGFPKDKLMEILKVARPIGDTVYISEKLGSADFDEFFTESRKHGLDNSIDYAYGGSTVPSINGISPFVAPIDVYMEMLDLPYESKDDDDEKKEDIFYAGHQVEPVLRNYFRRQFGDRYVVVNTDLQWQSKKWKHYLMNIDGLLYDKQTGQAGILEIKHTSHVNIGTIKEFEADAVPAHYDAQGRSYTEGFNLDFCIFYLGWGLRPEFTKAVRVEREQLLGESLLDACEHFIERNVMEKKPPSFLNVRDRKLVRKCIEETYGEVDQNKQPCEFDESMTPVFEELMLKKKAYDELKKKENEAKKKTEEALAEYEELQLPFIEIMKDAPYGIVLGGDGKRHTLWYNTRNSVNLEKLMNEFPDAYKMAQKPAIDTAALKKNSPEAYKACYLPSNGKRSFKVK